MKDNVQPSKDSTSRRSFFRKGLALGGAGFLSVGLFGAGSLYTSLAQAQATVSSAVTKGDVAILRFLAAIEILETDLWQQYNELGGIQDSEVPGGSGSAAYTKALQVLDGDMSQYIHDNTEDEISHFTFINAYLASKGAEPVNLDKFRTLQGSQATGAQKDKARLTNLMQLTVDTSWWTRYRSRTKNPDFPTSCAMRLLKSSSRSEERKLSRTRCPTRERWWNQQDEGEKEHKERESEGQPGKEAIRLCSEKGACPSREKPLAVKSVTPSLNRARWQRLLGRRTTGASLVQPPRGARCV